MISELKKLIVMAQLLLMDMVFQSIKSKKEKSELKSQKLAFLHVVETLRDIISSF